MKLLDRTDGRLVFQLGTREKTLLDRLLSLYPIQTDPEATLSRFSGDDDKMIDAGCLLRDSLRELRGELTDWIRLRLTDGEAFQRAGSSWRLTVDPADLDRFLRVLNELRVSSWTRLGCPEELDDRAIVDSPGQAPFHAIMTLSGQFAMALLMSSQDGLGPESSAPPEPPEPTPPAPGAA